MNTQEIDIEISKNQISFDLDGLQEEEESSTLSVLSVKNLEWIAQEVLFVVVKANHDDFIKNFNDFLLCGKSMIDWVKMAGNHCQTIVIEETENLIEQLKNIQTDKKVMAVFYSDTPLLDKSLFNEILNYFSIKGYNALNLIRGCIFKIDYLKSIYDFVQAPCSKFNIHQLEPISSGKMLACVIKELRKKINSYHCKNGVILLEDNINIDADVEIDHGVIIYGNNSIEGQTVIFSGAILKRGNIIKDSIIGKNVILEASYIEKSKISDGKIISPFEKITNSSL